MDLSLDLLEGKSTNEYAVLWTRSLAAATALAGGISGFDDFLDPSLPLVLEQSDGFVGAGVHAVGATVAAFVQHLRNICSQFKAILHEDGSRARGCCLGLQDGLRDALRGMRQPAQKDAIGHEVYRAQFHVGF